MLDEGVIIYIYIYIYIWRCIGVNKVKNRILIGLSVVVILCGVVFVAYRVLYTRDEGPRDIGGKYVVCGAKDMTGYELLRGTGYDSADYEARLLFANDGVYDMNFAVSRVFEDEASAKAFTGELHAKYNIYMGDNKIPSKGITPTFTGVDNTGKMVIAIKGDAYKEKLASAVMLDGVDNMNADEVTEHYKKLGFDCSIEEKDMVLSD